MSRKQQNQESKDVEPKTELSAIDGPSASSAAAPPIKEVESSVSVGDIETNRTYLCHTVSVPMSDIEGAVKTEMEKRCQAISAEFTELLQKLQGVMDKRFVVMDYDRVLTGKTGVAFGLLRSRVGGKDVKIIDNNKENGEITFPFYLGEIDRSGHFHVVIGHDSGYGKWVRFTYGDERVFELYYTLEPQAMEGTMAACEVSKVRCRLTPDEISDEEDVFVYIRKVKPDCIEYAVGKEADFTAGEVTKKIHSLQLNQ